MGRHKGTIEMRVNTWWLVGLVCVASVTAGCIGGSAGSTPSPRPQQAATPNEWKVDVPAPETTDEVQSNVVHGGAFCSVKGEEGTSKNGTRLICREAKDGRLRWQKPASS